MQFAALQREACTRCQQEDTAEATGWTMELCNDQLLVPQAADLKEASTSTSMKTTA